MKKKKIIGKFEDVFISAEDAPQVRAAHDKGRFGEPNGKRFRYSFVEALYLIEKNLMEIVDSRKKVLDFDRFLRKAKKIEPKFWVRYYAYKDMRTRGYIVKTALKFGADFRVYDRGVKPGADHAKWVMYAVHEGENFSWHEFSAKNRVAHSTKKNLLIGIVDDEGEVTYYEIDWKRP